MAIHFGPYRERTESEKVGDAYAFGKWLGGFMNTKRAAEMKARISSLEKENEELKAQKPCADATCCACSGCYLRLSNELDGWIAKAGKMEEALKHYGNSDHWSFYDWWIFHPGSGREHEFITSVDPGHHARAALQRDEVGK